MGVRQRRSKGFNPSSAYRAPKVFAGAKIKPDREFKLPKGVSASVAANIITLEGVDKALVGEIAAQIRKIRQPEPYKGKGVKYVEEIIRRKAGKAAAKSK